VLGRGDDQAPGVRAGRRLFLSRDRRSRPGDVEGDPGRFGAAASIVAKVARDRMMRKSMSVTRLYYGFKPSTKGSNGEHLRALAETGLPVHRRSFRCVTDEGRPRRENRSHERGKTGEVRSARWGASYVSNGNVVGCS